MSEIATSFLQIIKNLLFFIFILNKQIIAFNYKLSKTVI